MKITAKLSGSEIEAALRRDLASRGHEVVSVKLVHNVVITAEVEMKMSEPRDSDTLPEPMDEKTRAWALARAKACPDRSGD